MSSTYSRNRVTWLMYLMLAFFGYFLNILGPITPFLMDEFKLSYTVSSMHFTAFAAGLILVGLGGHLVVERIGRWNALWIGALGMSLGSVLLIAGPNEVLTILACFLMGVTGSLIPMLVSSVLSDQYGPLRAVALSEANMLASGTAAVAPVLVGWFTGSLVSAAFGWRLALALAVLVPVFLRLWVGKITLPDGRLDAGRAGAANEKGGSLPAKYWVFWAAIIMAVSVEFCMIFWSADYVEKVMGLAKASAALSVSLFIGGMILGRLVGSRLIQRFTEKQGILLSLAVSAAGFLLFWAVTWPAAGLTGLFLTGLGIANFYPLILSLALDVAGNNAVQAAARASLASGIAILALPLILGRLADMVGIRPAYGVVVVLLLGLFLIVNAEGRRSAAAAG